MFFNYYFLKLHLYQSSKKKSQKKSQNSINKFFLTFLACLKGSGSGSAQIMRDLDPDQEGAKSKGSGSTTIA